MLRVCLLDACVKVCNYVNACFGGISYGVLCVCMCFMCMCVMRCFCVLCVCVLGFVFLWSLSVCVMLRIYYIVIILPPATRGQQQGAEPAGCRTLEGWTQQHHPVVGQEDCSRPLPFICRSSRGEWLVFTYLKCIMLHGRLEFKHFMVWMTSVFCSPFNNLTNKLETWKLKPTNAL